MGQGRVGIAQTENPNRHPFGASLTYTSGFGEKQSAYVMSGGVAVRAYDNDPTPFGAVSCTEWSVPTSMGFRVHTVAGGGWLEYRRISRSAADSARSVGNAEVLLYGVYGRVALGRPGTVTGRFGIEGRYLWGYGRFLDLDFSTLTLQEVITADMKDPREWRLGISYLLAKRLLLRLDLQDTRLPVDHDFVYSVDVPPDALSHSVKAVGMTIGVVF